MDLKQALSLLNVPDADCVACFVVGSRAWGTAQPNSDFDLVVIVKDASPSARLCKGEGGIAGVHAGKNIDAQLVSEHNFVSLVEGCKMQVLVCMFLPDDLVWRCDSSKITECKKRISMALLADRSKDRGKDSDSCEKQKQQRSSLQLLTAVQERLTRDLEKAEKFFRKQSVPQGKKILGHALKDIEIALSVIGVDGDVEGGGDDNQPHAAAAAAAAAAAGACA